MFLVGFMGSGKNTVGLELAHRWRWTFVDLDAEIERREGRTIPEIFRGKGESVFRKAETGALRDLVTELSARKAVVALGGGAFAQGENRALLQAWPTVFLDARVDELWRRCQQDGGEPGIDHKRDRPLAKDRDQFERLHAERLPFYRQATLTVETSGKELPSICSEIENALRLKEAPENLSGGESQ